MSFFLTGGGELLRINPRGVSANLASGYWLMTSLSVFKKMLRNCRICL